MGVQAGLTCKAYYDDDNDFDTPTYLEMTLVVDVTIPKERTDIPVADRGHGIEKSLVGMKKFGVDVKLLRNNADAIQLDLETAYEAGTPVHLAFADGDIETEGTKYVHCDFVITKFQEGEPLEGASTIDMTVKPAAVSTNDPTVETVPAP